MMTETLDMPRRLQAWSYLRQQLGQAASGAIEALRGVVAVYSSHPTAPLSLLSRSESFDGGRFSEMEHRREVLRIPAMRQSIFLVPAKTAPRIFAATGLPMEKHSRRLRYAGLDWDEYTRLKQTVLEHLGDRMLVKMGSVRARDLSAFALRTRVRWGRASVGRHRCRGPCADSIQLRTRH